MLLHPRSFNSQKNMALTLNISKPCFFVVPVVGLEPTRYRYQRILSPPRLPFQHTGIFNFALPWTKFRILEGSRNAGRDICSIIRYVKWIIPEYSTRFHLTYLHFESTTSTNSITPAGALALYIILFKIARVILNYSVLIPSSSASSKTCCPLWVSAMLP